MSNIKEAIFMIKEALNNVSSETILNCWRKAGKFIIFIIMRKIY
jgi:hypothetical protein